MMKENVKIGPVNKSTKTVFILYFIANNKERKNCYSHNGVFDFGYTS